MDVMAIVAMQDVFDDKMLLLMSTLSRRVVTGLARHQALRRQMQLNKAARLLSLRDERRLRDVQLEGHYQELQSTRWSRNSTLQALAFISGTADLELARASADAGLSRALHRSATVDEVLRWGVRHSRYLLRERARFYEDDIASEEDESTEAHEM